MDQDSNQRQLIMTLWACQLPFMILIKLRSKQEIDLENNQEATKLNNWNKLYSLSIQKYKIANPIKKTL